MKTPLGHAATPWGTTRSLLLAALAASLLAGCGGGGKDHGSTGSDTPKITSQPTSVTTDLGSTARFAVLATGDDLTYQWLKGNTAIVGATEATYTIASVTVADLGTYSVRILGGRGATTSDPVVLALVGAPRVTTQPIALETTVGSPATFTVVAEGDAPLAYQWRKGDGAITGATGASYTIPATALGDAGTYSVVVSNAKGAATSNGVTLAVETPTPPAIVTPPASQSVVQGTAATFGIVANGTDLTYQWTKDGAPIPGATSSVYVAQTTDLTAAGVYKVVVSNGLGTQTSPPATLTILVPPTITTNPASQAVNAGTQVTFSVVASGPELRYQWTRDGAPISGATGSTYTLAAATASDAKPYAVVVSNAAASVTSATATLTVRIPPTILTGPVLRVNGNSTSVSVTASGTAPLAYQWYRSGVAVEGATGATYVIGRVNSSNSGLYSVVVSNAAGSVTSGTVAVVG